MYCRDLTAHTVPTRTNWAKTSSPAGRSSRQIRKVLTVAAKSDNNSDEKKTAGDEQARDVKTSKEVEDQEVPTTVEERGETDADAAGEKAGAVKDGDSGALEDGDEVEGEDAGFLGTVAERDSKGREVDVPWVYLTADHLPRTSDSDDPAKSWTAQDASGARDEVVALVEVAGTPGQTFRVSELPNREVAEAAGVDYNLFVSGLPVRPDVDDEAPRKGTPA